MSVCWSFAACVTASCHHLLITIDGHRHEKRCVSEEWRRGRERKKEYRRPLCSKMKKSISSNKLVIPLTNLIILYMRCGEEKEHSISYHLSVLATFTSWKRQECDCRWWQHQQWWRWNWLAMVFSRITDSEFSSNCKFHDSRIVMWRIWKKEKKKKKKREKDTGKGIKMKGKSETSHLLRRFGRTPDLNYVRWKSLHGGSCCSLLNKIFSPPTER